MVLRRCDPSAAVRLLHSPDWNWLPLSVVMDVGVPNLAIQPCKKIRAMVSARISVSGKASGQRVNLSITVRI